MPQLPLFSEAPDFTIFLGERPFPFSDLGAEGSDWSQKLQAGAGTFGAVVHWIKTDKDGNTVDEMAFKTIPWSEDDEFPNAQVGSQPRSWFAGTTR